MRRIVLPLLALLGLFLLSGCFKVDMDMTVKSDDTVSGTMVVGLKDSFIEMMNSMGGTEGTDPSDMFQTGDLPEGTSVEDYKQDGFTGQKVTFNDVPLDKLSETTSGEDGSDLSIVRDGDVFRLTGNFDMSTGDPGTGGEPFDVEALMADSEVRIQFTFPGEVTESNGEVDGNTVTWTPKIGEANELTAVADAKESTSSATAVVLVVGALVALAAVGPGQLPGHARRPLPVPAPRRPA